MTTLFYLHFLGGSARGWAELVADLPHIECPDIECLGLDLPGFGAEAATPGYDVASMAGHVAARIRARGAERWLLAGHSMGGKVAAAVARRAEDGEPGLSGLAGLILAAASPPDPEPMPDEKRQQMLGWFHGDAAASRAQAESFIQANLGGPVPPARRAQLIDDVLRMNPAAWTAWLTGGSREDWAARIGVLNTPSLVLAGGEDADLGEAAQHAHTLPHLADAETVTFPGAGHLLPMERPALMARLIASRFATQATVPAAYQALIDSPRVSSGTRAALMARLTAPASPLPPAERAVLRAVVDRIVPQTGTHRIDLAARLTPVRGDGWREATLPPDPTAWSAALRTLAGFAALDPAAQDAKLHRVAEGAVAGELDGTQMKHWFEDVRSEAVRHYTAHPATFARLRYSGIGYGGDGPDKPGFTRIGIGQREDWEPA